MATSSNAGLDYIQPSSSFLGDGSGLDYFTPSTSLMSDPAAPNTGPTESGTVPAGTSPTSSAGGLFSDLGSAVSGLFGGDIGNLALYTGLYGLVGSQAKSAAAENKSLAGQIGAIGQPAVSTSQDLLKSYAAGNLTDPFASQLSAALSANQRTAQSEQSQAAQLIANAGGGQNVQSALAGQSQQIQQARAQADTQAVANAFTSELSASESLLAAGGPYVQAGIVQTIQSNTQLQEQLAQLMGALANAYARSVAGKSGSSTASNPLGTVANDIGKLLGGSSAPGVSPGSLGIPTDAAGGLTGVDTGLGTLGPQLPSLPDYTATGAITGADLAGDAVTLPSADAITASGMAGVGDLGTEAGLGAAAGDVLPEAVVSAPAIGAGAVAGGELTGLTAADTNAAVNAGWDASGLGEGAGVSSGSYLGTALPIAGAALGAYGTYEGIEAGNPYTAGASGAVTGASIGSFAGPVGTVVGGVVGALVGIGGALIKGEHTQEGIAQVGANQDVIKLQSGNSALQQGGVAFGAGTDRAKGSAQWFLVPQTSTQLGNGPSVTKDTPFYIGSQASTMLTNFANSVPITNGAPDFSSYIAQYNANPNSGTGLVGVFNNNGGEATWGQSFPDWLKSIWAVKTNVHGNLTT